MALISHTFPANFDDEVAYALERQMLPCWERYGYERLVASASTLPEFREQSLPERVVAWERKRASRKILKRHRFPVVKHWLEEDQHSVSFPCLIYVRTGQAEFRLADYVAQCPQEHFILLRPGVPRPAGERPILEEPRQGKYCELWWFQPWGIGGEARMTLFVTRSIEEKEINSGHYYIVNEQRISHLFQYFVEEFVGSLPNPGKPPQVLLHAFLLLFLQEIKAGRFYNRGVSDLPKIAYGTASPIEMARQYIERNLNHPLTTDIVAQAVFMARTSFVRRFKEETGMNFHEYLTQKRLEQAQYWLKQDGYPIEAIYSFVGLKQSRFHELFREHFGITPLEYRKRYKNV